MGQSTGPPFTRRPSAPHRKQPKKTFEHDNYLTFGASVDRSLLSFSAKSALGAIFPNFVVGDGGFPGSGSIIATAGGTGYVPSFLNGNTTYYGVTRWMLLTHAGACPNRGRQTQYRADRDGRFDGHGAGAQHIFSRIDPVAGLTYKILPTVTAYGG